MKTFICIETQYFPPVDSFKLLASSTHVKIELWEYYDKRSFRNRCTIIGSNGLINLTVPISGGREQHRLIKDVEVEEQENWRVRHIRSIQSAYAKAPFFDHYFEQVAELVTFRQRSLLEMNTSITRWLLKVLDINCEISFTEGYEPTLPEGVADQRNTILPRNTYGEEWQPKYPQVFKEKHGFVPNLSILDLLFNQGPMAKQLLERSLLT